MTNRTLDSASFTSATAVGLTDVQPLMVGGVQQKISGQILKKEMGGAIASDTYANIVSGYAAASYSGYYAFATDIGVSGQRVYSNGSTWVPVAGANITQSLPQTATIVFGGSGATYSQTAFTVTVTKAGHGITADQNGCYVHLTQSTGTFVTEYCSGFTYVDANTFTCTSATSRSTSGNLGANTSETFANNSVTMPSWTKDGIQASVNYLVRGTSSANNKTYKLYYSGIMGLASSVQTTAIAGFVSISSTIRWVGATTFIPVGNTGATGNGIINTESNKLFTASVTLANATEWALIWPQVNSVNWRAA